MKKTIPVVALVEVLLSTTVFADSADDTSQAPQPGVILKAGEIDNRTVAVGAFAVVIYGQGKRHQVSGKWEQLVTVRGYVRAVEKEILTLGLGRDGLQERIVLDRIQTLVLVGMPHTQKGARAAGSRLAQANPRNSLTVKEMYHPPFSIENLEHRLFAKVAAGTASGAVVTGMAFLALNRIIEPKEDSDADKYREVGFLLIGSAIGCSFGFPLGVTLFDPYDSLYWTLFAGVIPGVAGYSLLVSQQHDGKAALLLYVIPVINSLLASEVWRTPLQDRGVSFGLSSTLNGGFSGGATLRF